VTQAWRDDAFSGEECRVAPTAIALIADHLPECSVSLQAYARQLSYHNGPASLICLDDSQSQWIDFNHDDLPDSAGGGTEFSERLAAPELRLLLGENGGEADFSTGTRGGILSDLAGRSETLLVSPAHRHLRGMREILSCCKTAVVFCRSDSEGVIDAYQAVKWLVTEMDYAGEISLFVCDGRCDNIDDVHRRLAQTAETFLHVDIPYAEYPQPCEVPMQPQNLPSHLSMDMTSHLINLLQAELGSNGTASEAQPKDPAGEVPPPIPPSDIAGRPLPESAGWKNPSSSSQPAEPAMGEPRLSSAKTEPSLPVPLRPIPVEEFPRTERQVADLLQMRVPMWLRHTPPALTLPVALPPPFDASFRVILDSQGRAYLLAVNLLGDPGYLSAALQAREWIQEHLCQSMRHFHQLNFAPGEEAGMILVLGDVRLCEQTRRQAESITQFPCHVVQLHFLQTESDNFILLI